MPARRPRRWSGIVSFHIAERKMPLIVSIAPGHDQARDSASHSAFAKPERRRSPPPSSAAPKTTARPWRCTRAVQPLVSVTAIEPRRRRRGVQQPEDLGAAVALGDGREERHRHAEEHRVHVDQVGPDEVLARAWRSGRPRGSCATTAARRRAAAEACASRCRTTSEADEAHDVDAVGGGQAGGGDEHAGERRAGERSPCCEKLNCSAEAALSSSRSHQARDERVERRAAHRREAGQQRRADVEDPEVRIGERRVDEQRAGHDRGADLGDLHEPPAIERVGQRPADEREHDDRRELGDAEQADGQRRTA